jgi:hypothetical protein
MAHSVPQPLSQQAKENRNRSSIAPEQIMTYLKLYRSLIGPQRETRSPCGLRLVKIHCLTHFPSQYRQFGNT